MRRTTIAIYALAALCICGCGVSAVGEQPAPTSVAAPSQPTAPPQPATMPAQPTMPPQPTTAPAAPTLSQPTAAPAAPTASPLPTSQTVQIKVTMLPERTAVPKPQATPAADASAIDPALAGFVENAKADLAQRQATTIDAITVLEARLVTWPDLGLGCPRPGMVYKQVPVDGLLIRLSLGGQIFSYHGGGDSGKPPFLCQQPK